MRDGYCPKCGSADVYRKDPSPNQSLMAGGWVQKAVTAYDYACGQCGYVETYVEEKDLTRIREHWEPVDPKQKRKNDSADFG